MEFSQRYCRQRKYSFMINASAVLHAVFFLYLIGAIDTKPWADEIADTQDDAAYSLMDLDDSAEEEKRFSTSLNVSSSVDDSNETASLPVTPGDYGYYAGYDDWIVPHNQQNNRWNQYSESGPADSSSDALPQTSVYSVAKNRWVMYDILHMQLSNLSANAYSIKMFKMNEHKRPKVKSVLKIFWTMDKTNMARKIHIIAAREREQRRLPILPFFVDATHYLDIEDRLHVIQRTFQEAFDYWSSVLYNRVIFEYIPYGDRLKQSSYFNMVIVVAMRDIVHIDEHTNGTERFLSKNTLAHAASNLIHFNGETTMFYIAPQSVSKHVYIVVDSGKVNEKKMKLYELSNRQLAERYRTKTYKKLYRQRREMINALVKSNNVKLECLLCIAVHEIGHVIGLGHINEKDSIMYPITVSNEATITRDDRQAARTIFTKFIERSRAADRQEVRNQCHKTKIHYTKKN